MVAGCVLPRLSGPITTDGLSRASAKVTVNHWLPLVCVKVALPASPITSGPVSTASRLKDRKSRR